MSTTPQQTESTTRTQQTESTTPPRPGDARRSHDHAGAPRTFSTTNRRPLPPAFGDEEWANGEP